MKGSANTDVFNNLSYNDCVILANSGFVECSSYDRKYIMRIQVQEHLKYEVQEVNLYMNLFMNLYMKKIPGVDFLAFPPINIGERYKRIFDLRKFISQSEIPFDLKQLHQLSAGL